MSKQNSDAEFRDEDIVHLYPIQALSMVNVTHPFVRIGGFQDVVLLAFTLWHDQILLPKMT